MHQPGTSPPASIYDHALTVGFSRAFEVAAGIGVLALLIAIATIRVRRQELSGAVPAPQEAVPQPAAPQPATPQPASPQPAAPQPGTEHRYEDRAAHAAAVLAGSASPTRPPLSTRNRIGQGNPAVRPCRPALSRGRGRCDRGREVRQHAQLREHGVRSDMAVELLILPSRTYQKSPHGMSSLAPVGWITPAGVWNGPRKVPWIDSSIAATSPGTLTRCSSR
jgi:hypothetical protein